MESFFSTCKVMCSSLARLSQGGDPASWGPAGCLVTARWGACARPMGSCCCSNCRRSQSLLQIPHRLPHSGSFTLYICSGRQVLLLRTVSFGGFPCSWSQKASQISEAEQSPFMGLVFQTTGVCKHMYKSLCIVPEIRHLEQTAPQASGQQ